MGDNKFEFSIARDATDTWRQFEKICWDRVLTIAKMRCLSRDSDTIVGKDIRMAIMDLMEPNIETGIPCFKCKKRSGIDCAGRKTNEPTLCTACISENLINEHNDLLKRLADS